jgi:hypothetical protein
VFTGIERPRVILALAQEGIDRSKSLFGATDENTLVLHAAELSIPPCKAEILPVDFKELRIKNSDRALASLALLASKNRVISRPMLEKALEYRFTDAALESAKELLALL